MRIRLGQALVPVVTAALAGFTIVGCESSSRTTSVAEADSRGAVAEHDRQVDAASHSSAPAAGIATTTAEPLPAGLSDDQRARELASFEQVWRTIQEIHWDPTLNGLDWQAVRDELRPQVEQAHSREEARAVMMEMIGRLGQSHFAILPSDVYESVGGARMEESQKPSSSVSASGGAPNDVSDSEGPSSEESSAEGLYEPGVAGIEVRVVDDQALVTRVDDRTPAHDLGVRPGWIVVSIDGDPIAPVIKSIAESYANSSLKEAMMSLAVQGMLERSIGGTASVVFLNERDESVMVEVPSIQPVGTPISFGHLPTMHMDIEQRMIGDDVGYFAFNMFFDPARLMREYGAAVQRFAGTRGIIIDLRGNPGGIGGLAMGMAGWLVNEHDKKLGTMIQRDFQLNFVINPRPTPYNGLVAVLVDECSMSTSEIFAGGLQDIGRARVFGTTTAGAALPSVIVRLPNDDGFQYAIANYLSADGEPLEGRGVVPDVVVTHDRAALLEGRDAVIEAAVNWIREGGS